MIVSPFASIVGGRAAIFAGFVRSWRRREGVEPSGDLTTPRLVLKTSGTTGHLPSPQVKGYLANMSADAGKDTALLKIDLHRVLSEIAPSEKIDAEVRFRRGRKT